MCALRLPPIPHDAPGAAPGPAPAAALDHPHAYVGWSTYPTLEAAEKAARALIDERLAACAQVDGPIRSFYRQQGRTHESQEWRLTLKFTHVNLDALTRRLGDAHPYDTPQWLAVRVDHAAPTYLAWMNGY